MTNPLRPINDAPVEIDRQQKQRHTRQPDSPNADVSILAKELTLIRAEMTVIRGLLAQTADKAPDARTRALWALSAVLFIALMALLVKGGAIVTW